MKNTNNVLVLWKWWILQGHYLTLHEPHLKNHFSIHYPFPVTCPAPVYQNHLCDFACYSFFPTMSSIMSRQNLICLSRPDLYFTFKTSPWGSFLCFCTTPHKHCFSIYHIESRGATIILKHPIRARLCANSFAYFLIIPSNPMW